MQRMFLVLLYFVILGVALMPPGVCPCWLMFDPAANHPHFDGHPEIPHDHEYLFDYFQSQTVAASSLALIPAALLIALQAVSGLLRNLTGHVLLGDGWAYLPPTPPPRVLGKF